MAFERLPVVPGVGDARGLRLPSVSQAAPTTAIAISKAEDAGDAAGVAEAAAAAAIVPVVQTVVSAATVTPLSSNNQVNVTAQAAALIVANPSGTALNGWELVVRIKDNGTARAITYGSEYRAIGVTLPTTTVISKTVYILFRYNLTDTKWDAILVAQEV